MLYILFYCASCYCYCSFLRSAHIAFTQSCYCYSRSSTSQGILLDTPRRHSDASNKQSVATVNNQLCRFPADRTAQSPAGRGAASPVTPCRPVPTPRGGWQCGLWTGQDRTSRVGRQLSRPATRVRWAVGYSWPGRRWYTKPTDGTGTDRGCPGYLRVPGGTVQRSWERMGEETALL